MEQVDISDRDGLVGEIEENLWESWSRWGCVLHDKEGILWFEKPIPIVPYNSAFRTRLQANTDQIIDGVVEHFACNKVQFMWIVHPTSNPPNLRARLQSRGLMDVEPILGMARSLEDLPELLPLPIDIVIRKVTDEQEISAFHQFAAWR